MSEPQQVPIPPPSPAEDSRNNCLLMGCVGIAAGGLLLVAAVTALSWFGLRAIADQFTETEPRQLRISTISEADYAALSERYDAFITATRANETGTITLNADELNALIRNHPDFREARGHVFVTIEDEVIGGEISFPIPDEFPVLGGRYLNGSATFLLDMAGGRPQLYFETIEVAGRTPPDEIVGQLRQENLLQNAYQDPQFAQVLNRIESIRVAGGEIVVTTK